MPSSRKEKRGSLTVEVFTDDDGTECYYAEGPCAGCGISTEGDYEPVEDDEGDDWWCSTCWPEEDRKRMRAEIAKLKNQLATITKKHEQYQDWMSWYRGTDTGISSLTIFSVMTGIPVRSHSIPWDRGDFGRCHRLLERFPEWKCRLDEVAEQFPQWKPLVDNWPQLEELYLARDDEGVYIRMKELIDQ